MLAKCKTGSVNATSSQTAAPTLPSTQQRVLLKHRPVDLLAHSDVELVTEPIPELENGEALVHNEAIGIDASVRTWLGEGSGYFPPVEIGECVRSSTIGRIVATQSDRYEIGQVVTTLGAWEEYTVVRDDFFTTFVSDPDPEYDVEAFMALYGSTGATAYIGMLEVAAVQKGDTVVVSAAAGATGSVAAQLAKLKGATVIGTAGGAEKCAWLVDELGLDGAIDYRSEDLSARLRELAPKRVDVFFDNVGGAILDAVLGRIAPNGRIALCGHISTYTESEKSPGPANYVQLIQQQATMKGFLAYNEIARFPEIAVQLEAWHKSGDLQLNVDRHDGLEHCVDALNAMFTGANIGKILVTL